MLQTISSYFHRAHQKLDAFLTYLFSGGLISMSWADIETFLQGLSLIIGITLGLHRIYIDRVKFKEWKEGKDDDAP